MQEVSHVISGYTQEIEDTAEGVRQQSHHIQADTRELADISQRALRTDQLYDTVSSVEAVDTPVKPVIEAMGWASVLILVAELASFCGAYLFRPLIGLFFGKFGAAFFAYFGFPFYGLYTVYKAEQQNENDPSVRFSLLSLSLTQGLLSGFVLSSRFVSAQPLAAVAPAVVAVAFPHLVSSLGRNRRLLVAAASAAALLANLALAFVSGYMTTSFVSLSLIYVALTAFVLQAVLHKVHSAATRVHVFQLVLATSFLVAKAAFFGIFGSRSYVDLSKEEL